MVSGLCKGETFLYPKLEIRRMTNSQVSNMQTVWTQWDEKGKCLSNTH